MDNKLEYIPGDLAFHYIPKTIIKKYVKVYVCSTQNALSLEDMDGKLYDYIGELYPIPLTPEILEKNGWMLYHLYYWFVEKECLKLRLLEFDNYTWDACIGGKVIRINMYSVSDLQHLLFGLNVNHEMEV